MTATIDLNAPLFSGADLKQATGLDDEVFKVWLKRGTLRPARREKLAVRSRPHFSIIDIFKAKLAAALGNSFPIGPSLWMEAAEEMKKPPKQAVSPVLVHLLADEGWMWAVARSVERGKPLALFAAVTSDRGCWEYHLGLQKPFSPEEFGAGVPYLVIPVGEWFASVYRKCQFLLRDRE